MNQSEVRRLVAGGSAFICDGYAHVAIEVIGTEQPKWLDELREAIDKGEKR
jgi:hypothetical protein